MNYHTYFGRAARPVETCILGTGGFGRSFLAQALKVPLMGARIAVDVSAESAAAAMRSVGISPERIAICETREAARVAWDSGAFIAAGRLEIVLDLPIDVVVEATGDPESGARHARIAIDAGRHVALVSKEVDSVIGPGLTHRARRHGRIVTPVDGDQPSLLIGLITWAEVLGLEILAAGKPSEYDFVYDPEKGTLTSNGRTIAAPEFAACAVLGSRDCGTIAKARASAAAGLPQRAVPDLCELTIVANATGFCADRPDLHAPIARIGEVADFFALKADGGVLEGSRRLDVFHCLRLPDEVSFAGGVFVVVRCDDETTWTMLREKGHVLSRSGKAAMLYLPRHLLGLEAATSVLEAALLNVSSGSMEAAHHVDLVAHADRDLPAGTVLHMGGHHHSIAGVSARIVPAGPLGPDRPVPFYLAANGKLVRPVAKGELIRCDDVEPTGESALLALRREQDALFFSGRNSEATASGSS